jgi:hypothetical protein
MPILKGDSGFSAGREPALIRGSNARKQQLDGEHPLKNGLTVYLPSTQNADDLNNLRNL